MKAMETEQMVALPADALKAFPQTKMAPNPVSPVNMVSVTNGATPVPATNGETLNGESEKAIENGENGITQPSGGVKRKDDGGISRDSKAPDLKKIRLFKDSDDEDDIDDPAPQTNGNSSDNDIKEDNDLQGDNGVKTDNDHEVNNDHEANNEIENELQKRLEDIPEKTKEMETAQTEAINVLGEVNKVLEANETKESNENSKEGTTLKSELKEETKLKSEILKEETKVKSKLRRLSRRELENMIVKKLNEKVLTEHELGKLKQLSEKLTTTLETNMKKTAQFHKEIDDMKKVTQKLMQDHHARKGQYVAPIRIKRSVGIQATENIIKKGAMYTSNGTGPYKTIAARPGVSKGPIQASQTNTPTSATFQTQGVRTATSATSVQTLGTVKATTPSGTTQMLMVQPGHMVSVPRSAVTAALSGSNHNTVNSIGSNSSVVSVGPSRMIRAPIVAPQGSVLGAGQQRVLIQQQPSSKIVTASTAITTTSSAKTNSGAVIDIDLTDEDEGNRARTVGNLLTTPGTVLKVPVSTATGTSLQPAILVVQQSASSGVPRASAVLVSNVVSPVTTGLTTTLVSASRVNSTASTVSKPSASTGATAAAAAVVAAAAASTQGTSRHPAPLPRTPPQQQVGGMRNLPPQPTLKLSHKENSIVLSWTMSKTEEHESIASYQLYAYQEGTTAPSSELWKKVGSVKALELPMACTLTQFMPGHVYHFAVRAVDTKSRLGPFSDPRSIRLDR